MNLTELIVKFYILNYYEVIIIFLLFVSAFVFCSNKFERYLWWKLFVVAIAIGTTVIIFKTTVIDRQINSVYNEINFIPLHSYYRYFSGQNNEALRCNLMNMLLFVPLGISIGDVLPQGWNLWKKIIFITGASLVFSTSIECFQYIRQCGEVEVDDVINNTLGATFGMLSVSMGRKLLEKLKNKSWKQKNETT